MDDNEKQATVPYFIHEGDMARMDMAMERMKKALTTVCITLIAVVVLFVDGYTINNNNWMKYVERMQTQTEEKTDAEAKTSGVRQYRHSGGNQTANTFRG